MALTDEEVRILGCLIEKGATTPDQYPLSTNALVNACNQKSNRYPTVDFAERLVVDTMLLLRPAGLARTVTGGRADKHKHVLDEAWGVSNDELALLAIIMLRGPQSPGELKTRTDRYPTSHGSGFEELSQVEAVLAGLAARQVPLVLNIGRGSGQSQDRWAHLLGSEVPDVNDVAPTSGGGGGGRSSSALAARVEQLEARLATLEEALGISPPEASVDEAAASSGSEPLSEPQDDPASDPVQPHSDLPSTVIRSDGY